jgi:hypothetical protein
LEEVRVENWVDEYQRRLLGNTTEDCVVEIQSCHRRYEQWFYGMQSNEDVFKPAASVNWEDKKKIKKYIYKNNVILLDQVLILC